MLNSSEVCCFLISVCVCAFWGQKQRKRRGGNAELLYCCVPGRIIFLSRYSGSKRIRITGFFLARFAMVTCDCSSYVQLLVIQLRAYAGILAARQEAVPG